MVFFILVLVTLMQCQVSRAKQLQKQYKTIYIDQFKLVYFRQMLLKSYNNSDAIQEIISADHSGFTEPILTAHDYKLIDSLTTVDNRIIKADSAEGNRRAEGAQGIRPLKLITDRLSSGWLDSLASKRYKISGVKENYR